MRFSIITCTYNSAQYLQRNIDSVERQTCQDFEHIFIDGFSSDDTMGIIEQYRKKYPDRVRVIQSKPRGISHAMNEGITAAQGMYINHLHSDDTLHDNMVLEHVQDFITAHDAPDMIYGKTCTINTSNGMTLIWPQRALYKEMKFWRLLFVNYIPHQSVFIKKDVFVKYGNFDETLKSVMDYDLWLRLAKQNVTAVFYDRVISDFMLRADSQSTVDKYNTEQLAIHRKHLKNPFLIHMFFWIDRLNRIRVYKLRKSTRI